MYELDRDYPMGNPAAPTCRECRTTRIRIGEALFCRTCDGLGYTTALTNAR